MTGPSYATAASAATPATRHSFPQHHVQGLYTPTPTSMPLVAALYLLDNPLFTKTNLLQVSLIPKDYLQNWLVWAYHQPVIQEETRRLQLAVRMAAEMYQLQVPKLNDEYIAASPVDSSSLSDDKEPLVLREKVVLWDGRELKKGERPCCAVPGRFYEILRSVHGVLSENGKFVSWQGEEDCILHDPTKPPNGHLRPIDFFRKVIMENESTNKEEYSEPQTAVTKLMKQQQDKPSMIPTVELYPQKFAFQLVSGDELSSSETERSGSFLMASKTCNVTDVLNAVMKKVAPQSASPCVRLWCKHQTLRQDGRTHATRAGDGYELVDLVNMEGKMSRPDIKKEKSESTVEEWVARRGGVCDLLVETRMNHETPWSRASLELENRVQVGDYVDAQDPTGKWYEAIVRDIADDMVTVHYAGWATRWNGKIRRRNNGQTVETATRFVVAPAPLWTHTKRWRETIEIGHQLEVRDSTSNVQQPKWFRGTICRIGQKDVKPKELYDGAMLEKLEVPITASVKTNKHNKLPLLILKRTHQILVEIAQEKHNNPALVLQTANDGDEENPPFIRWVNLYGEEICTPGTHMKIIADEKRPATITYDFDPRKPPVEILKTNLGSGFVRESLRGQPPAPGSVGLQNLGNSCFMNSIVQCLNHCDPVSEYFVSEEYAQDLNRKNPLGSGGRVAMAYASLLSDIWRGQYSVLAPRLLKQTIANFAPQFNNVYQHDSHEFCSFLMDGIHEDCNRVETKPYVEELEGFGLADSKIAIESWRRHLLRHDSVIVDHCQGMHRSHVTCPICSRESIKFDVFSSLSVPLTSRKDRSFIPLEDCLEKFTEGEQLDENNGFYCSNCKKHVCALKMLALWSVPDILIIHLKRFTYETKNGGVVRNKIEDRVIFPVDNLDMSPYLLGPVDDEAPPLYNLFGVSEHTGTTANSGHYTATVRNSKDGKWYRYNDSHVGTSSGEASVTGGAYLLFYKRAKGTAKWAGMDKAMKEADIDPHGALETDVDGFKAVKTKMKKNKKKAAS